MVTGELKSKIDAVWNDFWSGGISNPLEVMEQLTYLLFIKGLDEAPDPARSARPTAPASRSSDPIFPDGDVHARRHDAGRPYADLRWDRFKNLAAARDVRRRRQRTSSRSCRHAAASTTHAKHMKGARFTIPTPALLAEGGRRARRDPDGGPRHQGRRLRVHALARSPPPGRTASSAPRATSSS